MSVEAGVLLNLDCEPIYWHLPEGRHVGALPDSRELWCAIWERREDVLGFAHSHPGLGEPEPSDEDLTTFAAIELALGKRLVWWISSRDQSVEVSWRGPGRLDYSAAPVMYEPDWVSELRTLSRFRVEETWKTLKHA